MFAVIVRTEQQESFSGLRLHAFQAEQKTVSWGLVGVHACLMLMRYSVREFCVGHSGDYR